MNINIKDYLTELKGRSFTFIPNPGNAGDSLISVGTYQVFKQIGLNFINSQTGHVANKNETIVYGGGGNLVNKNSFSYRTIKKLHQNAKRLIILPHSIKDVDNLIEDFNSNVDVICREQRTFDYVKSHASNCNVYLCDDMAFNIDLDELKQLHNQTLPSLAHIAFDKVTKGIAVMSISNRFKAIRASNLIEEIYKRNNTPILYCFRTDGESTGLSHPKSLNIDLSLYLSFGASTPESSYFSANLVFRTIGHYSEIHSDRLHMSIAGTLLGKKVSMHDNNYGKCSGVYMKSIKGKYSNVELCSTSSSVNFVNL